MQEKPSEGPISNFSKSLYRQSLNRNFGTHVQKSMVFKTLKKNNVPLLEIKLLAKKTHGREKFSTSQKLKVS